MTRVAAGEAEARTEVANRLAHRVRRLSRMMLLDDATADDAAQNSLIEILRSAHTFRGRSSLERWADRITARTSIRHGRDERRRDALTDEWGESEAQGLTAPHPSDGALKESTPRAVEEYLRELSEPQREVLVMKHSLGYTTEEIARATGAPVGTIKDRLVTARRQIRKSIQRDLAIGVRKTGGAQ